MIKTLVLLRDKINLRLIKIASTQQLYNIFLYIKMKLIYSHCVMLLLTAVF